CQGLLQKLSPREPVLNSRCEQLRVSECVANAEREERIFVRPCISYEGPSWSIGFAKEVWQIGAAIESFLTLPRADPLLEVRHAHENVHETIRYVLADSTKLRDRPRDEDGRQSIVGRERKNHIAITEIHFETIEADAAPIGEVPASQRRSLHVHKGPDSACQR